MIIIELYDSIINQQSQRKCRTEDVMKKQPEVTEQTRKNIIAAFCRLYAQRPIEQIYVKDVISEAGYNRSTFYEYFQDIYALLNCLEDDVIDYIKGKLDKKTRTQADLLQLLSEKEKYLKALMGPFGCVHFQDRLKAELTAESEVVISDERFEPYFAEFHIEASLSLYRLWLNRGKDISLNELTTLIHTLYTHGASGIIGAI